MRSAGCGDSGGDMQVAAMLVAVFFMFGCGGDGGSASIFVVVDLAVVWCRR